MSLKNARDNISIDIKRESEGQYWGAVVFLRNFYIYKLSGRLYALYPVNSKSSKKRIFFEFLLWLFYLMNHVAVAIAIVWHIYRRRTDLLSASSSSIELLVTINSLMLIVFCRMQKLRMQTLLKRFESFIKNCDEIKANLLRKEGKKYMLVFGMIYAASTLAIMLNISRKYANGDVPLPYCSYYPFPLTSSTLWHMLFAQHTIVTLYALCVIYIDLMIYLLFFVAIIELKLLVIQGRNIDSYPELVKCVVEHQRIIRHTQETNRFAQMFIIGTILTMAVCLIDIGLILFNPEASYYLRFEFILVLLLNCLRLFAFSLCTECMVQLGYDMGFAVYLSGWDNQNAKLALAKSIIICRCQKPLTLSVPGMLSSLDLKYISRFLYVMFSYIMAIRAVTFEKKHA